MPLVYPKAQWTPTGVDGGSYIGGPPRGVWHETITAPSAFFTGATYYHIQLRQWPLTDRPRWRQFIDFERASRALRNLRPGGNPTGDSDVQTNRMGDYCINVALVGYQTARSNGFPSLYPLSDAMVNEAGEFMEWHEARTGIPFDVSALISDPGQQEYGYLAPHRFSSAEWRRFAGWCGHERVTENTHHDPYWKFGQQMKVNFLEPQGDPAMQPPNWATAATQWHIDNGIYTESRPEDVDEDVEFHRQTVFRHRFYQRVVAPALRDAANGAGDGKGTIALSEVRDLKARLNQATR